MESLLDRLRNTPSHSSGPVNDGHWKLIQFALDPATGERINVGVVLTSGERQYVKLVSNIKPLGCIYGNEALENIAFSFSLLRDMADSSEPIISPSTNFFISEGRDIQFGDASTITESLYYQLVPLSMREEEQHSADMEVSPIASINTTNLRKKVLSGIKKQNSHLYGRICRDHPVPVKADDGSVHSIDMPIWAEAELYKGHHYGSIVSTWQRSQLKRGFDLNAAYRNLDIAKKVGAIKNAQGALFILRPDDQITPEYSDIMTEIDNEIDQVGWMMKKEGVHLEVSESVEKLTNLAIAFAA